MQLLDSDVLAASSPGECFYDDGIRINPTGQDFYTQPTLRRSGIDRRRLVALTSRVEDISRNIYRRAWKRSVTPSGAVAEQGEVCARVDGLRRRRALLRSAAPR